MNISNILYCPLDLPPIPKSFTKENIGQYYDFFPVTDPEEIQKISSRPGYKSALA